MSKGVNVVCDGVRVSCGHLCVAEAPTEAAAETALSNFKCAADLLGDHHTPKVVNSSHLSSCGARLCAHLGRGAIVDRGASFRSLHLTL